MKKPLLAAIILAASPLLVAPQAQATTGNSSDETTHAVGYGVGVGNLKSNQFRRDSETQTHIQLYYSYRVSEHWSVNVEYLKGESGGFFGSESLPSKSDSYDKLEYRAYALRLKGSLAISNRWRFYGKLGGHAYKTEFIDRINPNYDDSGFNINAALGFEFRAFSGFGIGFEGGHIKMGDAKANTQGIYLSYAF